MSGRIDIINSALTLLGEPLVIDPASSKPGRRCDAEYDKSRDATLRAHPWNFAVKRAALNKHPTNPEFGWDAQFELPGDYLRVLWATDDPDALEHTEVYDSPYRIEGRFILYDTTSTQLYIKYIWRQTNEALFDSMFEEAFAARLAYAVAPSVTQARTSSVDLFNLFKDRIRQAESADAQESSGDIVVGDGSWIESRQ